jgi:hypothetical protein
MVRNKNKPHKRLLILLSVAIVAGLSCWPVAKVLAHSLEQDGPITAVLHIAPDDDPVAGVPTNMFLDFTSTDPDFSLDSYTVTVTLQGVSTSSAAPTTSISKSSDTNSGSAQVVFPQAGTYKVIVRGTPISTPSSHSKTFSMTFNVRAERQGGGGLGNITSTTSFDALLVFVASFGLLIIVARQQIARGGRYQKRLQ